MDKLAIKFAARAPAAAAARRKLTHELFASPSPEPVASCADGCVEEFHANAGCEMWHLGQDPTRAIPQRCESGCEEPAHEYCTEMGLPPADEGDEDREYCWTDAILSSMSATDKMNLGNPVAGSMIPRVVLTELKKQTHWEQYKMWLTCTSMPSPTPSPTPSPSPHAMCPDHCIHGFFHNGGCATLDAGQDPSAMIPQGCADGVYDCEHKARHFCTMKSLPPVDPESSPSPSPSPSPTSTPVDILEPTPAPTSTPVDILEPTPAPEPPVVLRLVAKGSVSDYAEPAKRIQIKTKVAQLAGVDPTFVSIKIEAASVLITATIDVPPETTVEAVQSSLTTSLASNKATQAFEGVLEVEEVRSIMVASPPSSPPPSPSSPPPPSPSSPSPSSPPSPKDIKNGKGDNVSEDSGSGALVPVIVILAVLVVLVGGFGAFYFMRKQSQKKKKSTEVNMNEPVLTPTADKAAEFPPLKADDKI